MSTVHDPCARQALRSRIQSLRPDSQRQWGKMSTDQMLWHVNRALETALGHITPPRDRPPLPRALMRVIVLNLPWPQGAPTPSAFVAKSSHDFHAERGRCLGFLDELAEKDLNAEWPPHPALGSMSGDEHSRLQHKHVDHHLRQFGV